MNRLKHITHATLLFFSTATIITACSSIDCPLNNTVYATWGFYDNTGTKAVTLSDTLYVKAFGTDSVLINKLYNASGIQLPMSYYDPADTLLLEIHAAKDTLWYADTTTTQQAVQYDSIEVNGVKELAWYLFDYPQYTNQVIVSKTNQPHFNSPECGVWVEHTITGIDFTKNFLENIQVVNPKIDNNEQENFRICFK